MTAAVGAQLRLAGRDVPFEVRRTARARRMTLTADPARGVVRLSMPARMPAGTAEEFLQSRLPWLESRVRSFPQPKPYLDGAKLPFGDETLVLRHLSGSRSPARQSEGELVIGGPPEMFAARAERWFRSEARRTFITECDELAGPAGIDLRGWRISVRDTRRQWGSCSARKALSFAWRLIHAPVFVRQAIAAHELAHIVHPNHSRAFHREAERILHTSPEPAYAWLKANGSALHWIGRE
ncbi:hypothetical protein B5C34_03855 [Pacificimonas flava]|uniref:YgjP-like metallopeptidase domain-containing protein n=2 Tax=Pacificimonas TaxID=1960290 RepID=A0A219B2V3_9SPHN|nr:MULTISPECIES: YgjP-like metallopeptidase domain-containing protein [Pacificimonas]MBZ6377648.1 DUF45 domain-containing protein [Pacificimonas aurantium]OWV32667.1 hypothetical protein B5C34_03855 [Pacificimonas flava]